VLCIWWVILILNFFFCVVFILILRTDRYRPYEEDWPYWEVALQMQKCMLTGAMCAIEPGSPMQLLIALLCCLAYMLLVLHAGPCTYFCVLFSLLCVGVF
jgi:hypothetical protein